MLVIPLSDMPSITFDWKRITIYNYLRKRLCAVLAFL